MKPEALSGGILRVYLRSAMRSLHRDPIETQREACRALAEATLPERFAVTVDWATRHEYLDDAATQSSVVRRDGLWLLLHETQGGDIVIVRDLRRLGPPEACAATVHGLIHELGARLFTCEPAAEVVDADAE